MSTSDSDALIRSALKAISEKTGIKNPVLAHSAEDVVPSTGKRIHLFAATEKGKPNDPAGTVALDESGAAVDLARLSASEGRSFFKPVSPGVPPDVLEPRKVKVDPRKNDLRLEELRQFHRNGHGDHTQDCRGVQSRRLFPRRHDRQHGIDPAAVQTGASDILNALNGLGLDLAYGVGNYKDFPNDPYAFAPQQSVTTVAADAQAAINAWSSSGGSDGPEGQFFALDRLAEPPAGPIGWRAGSKRIIVWIGDAGSAFPSAMGFPDSRYRSMWAAAGLTTPCSTRTLLFHEKKAFLLPIPLYGLTRGWTRAQLGAPGPIPMYEPRSDGNWRWCRREDLRVPVRLEHINKHFQGTTLNLSPEGALIRLGDHDLVKGTLLSIALPNQSVAHVSDAEVIEICDKGVCVMFCNTTDPFEHFLTKIFENQLQRGSDQLRRRLGILFRCLKRDVCADIVTVRLYDKKISQFHSLLAFGLEYPAMFFDPAMTPGTDNPAGNVLRRLEPIYGYNPSQASAFAWGLRLEKIRYAAGFPIVHNSNGLGIAFFNYRHDRQLEPAAIERIKTKLKDAGAEISKYSDIFRQPADALDLVAQAVCRLAMQVLQRPVAMWRTDSTGKLVLCGAIGIPTTFLKREIATSNVAWSPRLQSRDTIVHLSGQTDLQWVTNPKANVLPDQGVICPAYVDQKLVALLVVFIVGPHKEADPDKTTLLHLGNVAAIAMEEHALAMRVKFSLESSPDTLSTSTSDVMTRCVREARVLIGADSADLFLFDRDKQQFSFGASTRDDSAFMFRSLPRPTGGLTRYIIDTTQPYPPENPNGTVDPRDDPLAQKALGSSRSLIGMPLMSTSGGTPAGVLYVKGYRPGQFAAQAQTYLRLLAQHTSVALDRANILLGTIAKIEDAITQIGNVSVWKQVCHDVTQEFSCVYVSLQLVRPNERIVETVYEEGSKGDVSVIKRHTLVAPEKFRDIEADVVLARPQRVEVITGWYDKFDPWIYKQSERKPYTRIFIPIVLLFDSCGQLVESNWVDAWHEAPKERFEIHDCNGHRLVLHMASPANVSDGCHLEVIGTFDAAFLQPTNEDVKELAVKLLRFVNRQGPRIYSTCLESVLAKVALEAWRSIDADAAAVAFPWSRTDNKLITSGNLDIAFVRENPPRPDIGLGARALRNKVLVVVPNPAAGDREDALKEAHLAMYKHGVRALVAIPIGTGADDGVLYVHRRQRAYFLPDELAWLTFFAKRMESAIEQAARKVLELRRELVAKSTSWLTRYLADNPDSDSLLTDIAGYSVNMLAADTVILWELHPVDGHPRRKEVVVAGKLRDEAAAIRSAIDYYSKQDLTHDTVFMDDLPDALYNTEKLRSLDAFTLRIGHESLGAMLVGYRRPRARSERDDPWLALLGYIATYAIKTRRTLRQARRKAALASLVDLIGINGRVAHKGLVRRTLEKLITLEGTAAIETAQELARLLQDLHELLSRLAKYPGVLECRGYGNTPDPMRDSEMVATLMTQMKDAIKLHSRHPALAELRQAGEQCHRRLFCGPHAILARYWASLGVLAVDVRHLMDRLVQEFRESTWPDVIREKASKSEPIAQAWRDSEGNYRLPVIVPIIVSDTGDSTTNGGTTYYVDGQMRNYITEVISNVVHRRSSMKRGGSSAQVDMWCEIKCMRECLEISFLNACATDSITLNCTAAGEWFEYMQGEVSVYVDPTPSDLKVARTVLRIPAAAVALKEKI